MSLDAPPGWARVGQDRVAYDGFTRVVHRTLRLPDGRETVWDLLDVPPTVAVLALTPSSEVVLVRQFRVGPWRPVASLPGGIVDNGEAVADAAARELLEETGHTAAELTVIGNTHPNYSTNPHWVAVARGCLPTHPQDLDEFEDCEVLVWPLDAVRRELRTGRLGAAAQTYLALDHLSLL